MIFESNWYSHRKNGGIPPFSIFNKSAHLSHNVIFCTCRDVFGHTEARNAGKPTEPISIGEMRHASIMIWVLPLRTFHPRHPPRRLQPRHPPRPFHLLRTFHPLQPQHPLRTLPPHHLLRAPHSLQPHHPFHPLRTLLPLQPLHTPRTPDVLRSRSACRIRRLSRKRWAPD